MMYAIEDPNITCSMRRDQSLAEQSTVDQDAVSHTVYDHRRQYMYNKKASWHARAAHAGKNMLVSSSTYSETTLSRCPRAQSRPSHLEFSIVSDLRFSCRTNDFRLQIGHLLSRPR